MKFCSKSEEELKAAQELKDRVGAQIEERVRDPAAAREKRLRESRDQLVDLRDKLTNILKQDWKQFEDIKKVISAYVFLLNGYPCKRDEIWSDVSLDLNILKELRDKLEYKYAEAEKIHYKEQYTFLYSFKKRAVMLNELDLASKNRPCTFTPDMIRCSQQILEGVDLKHMLEFADRKEAILSMGRAKKIMEEVQIPEFSDHMDFHNPELVMEQFKGYEEKVKASSEISDNLKFYIGSLPVLKAVKSVLLRLERMCLLKSVKSKRMCLWNPDDDIKLLEKTHDAAQKAMKAEKSGKTSNKFKELLNLVASCNVRPSCRFRDL